VVRRAFARRRAALSRAPGRTMQLRTLLSRELVRYGFVSAIAFVVDAGLLWALVNATRIHYLIAATLSFLAGGLVAYLLSIRFVFVERRLRSTAIEGPAFVVLGTAGLGVNVVVMALAFGFAGVPLLVSKVASGSLTFAVNYLLRKHLLFRRGRREHPLPPGA
jgi:putative flippase GtrA